MSFGWMVGRDISSKAVRRTRGRQGISDGSASASAAARGDELKAQPIAGWTENGIPKVTSNRSSVAKGRDHVFGVFDRAASKAEYEKRAESLFVGGARSRPQSHYAVSYPSMALTSRYSSKPKMPCSRPLPDCLYPPNGTLLLAGAPLR